MPPRFIKANQITKLQKLQPGLFKTTDYVIIISDDNTTRIKRRTTLYYKLYTYIITVARQEKTKRRNTSTQATLQIWSYAEAYTGRRGLQVIIPS